MTLGDDFLFLPADFDNFDAKAKFFRRWLQGRCYSGLCLWWWWWSGLLSVVLRQ
jgi:hypothetical protein